MASDSTALPHSHTVAKMVAVYSITVSLVYTSVLYSKQASKCQKW